MKPAIAVRRSPRARDVALLAAAVLVCAALGRLLPGKLESLSPTKIELLPVVLVFVLVAGLLALARPLAAFTLGFALLGIVRIQPAPVDVVFALLIATSFVVQRVRPRVPAFVAFPLLAFVLLSILSIANAAGLHRALQFEAITIYMIALAVWLSWAFTQPDWVHAAAKAYIVVAVISAALGPLALYLPLPGKNLFLWNGSSRAEGLFKDPNVYSAFLVPAAIILLEELTTPRLLKWRRSAVVGAFGVVSLGVLVAYSRAAWLDYALAVATLLFVQATRRGGLKRAFGSMTVILVSATAAFVVLSATGSLAFLRSRSKLENYDTQRFSTQADALHQMTRHVFGYGPGQSEVLLPISTHSTYARAAFEQGLLGLAAVVLVFAGTMLCAFLLARRRLDVHGVGTAALLGIWLGQCVNSFFIDTLHWRHLWIIAGLIWGGYAMTLRGRRGGSEGVVASR